VDALMTSGFCRILEDGIPLIQIAIWNKVKTNHILIVWNILCKGPSY
jgi:hypothetical protein